MSITIEVPQLPPADLNPNARLSHWAERHRAAKAFRKAAWAMAYNANPQHEVLFQKARVKVHFVAANYVNIPDPDNAVAMMKPALDGCVDAKIIPDDSAEYVRYGLPFTYEVDVMRGPLTIMTFEEDL